MKKLLSAAMLGAGLASCAVYGNGSTGSSGTGATAATASASTSAGSSSSGTNGGSTGAGSSSGGTGAGATGSAASTGTATGSATTGSTTGSGSSGSGSTAGGSTGGSTGAPDGGACSTPIAPCSCGASPGAQACQGGVLGACVCSSDGSGGPWAISGNATLVGDPDAGLPLAGITAALSGGGLFLATATDGDGGYAFTGLPAGDFSLDFEWTATLPADAGFPAPGTLSFAGTIPDVQVAGDGGVFLVDNGTAYPFDPIALPAGQQLTTGLGSGFAFSADGSALAFVVVPSGSNVGSLELVSAPGGVPTQIATGVAAFHFSPDGTTLAFTANASSIVGPGTLEVVPAAGGSPRTLTPVANAFQLAFSPVADSLACIGNGDAGAEIDVVDVSTGVVTPVAQTGGASTLFQFSPNGNQLVFITTGSDGGFALSADTLGTGQIAQIASNVILSPPAFFQFGADGNSLAYELPGGTVELASLTDGGASVQLAAGAGTFALSPDGTQLAYLPSGVSAGTLELVPVSNPDAGTVVGDNVFYVSVQFSPDGTQLAYVNNVGGAAGTGTLQIASVANPASSQQIASGVEPSDYYFSPDSAHLATFANRDTTGVGTLVLASLGSSPSPVVTVAAKAKDTFSFSPDGSWLAFLTDYDSNFNWGTLNVATVAGAFPVELNAHVQSFTFGPTDAIAATRTFTPPPFSFQDGVYLTPLP